MKKILTLAIIALIGFFIYNQIKTMQADQNLQEDLQQF